MSKILKSLLIVSISTLFISIVLYISLYIYTKKNIEKTVSVMNQIKESNYRNVQARKLVSIVENSKELQTQLKTYLVPNDDIIIAVELIESLAKKAGVEISISSLEADDSSTKPKGTINKIKARVDAKGEWKSTLLFLSLVESLPYKALLNNISLRTSEIVNKKQLWNLSFRIEIFKIK